MDIGKSFRSALLVWTSVDFWLFVISFISSGFLLQELSTILSQVAALFAILAFCAAVSFMVKRKSGWVRRPPGLKGVLSAIGVMLFVGYAICMFSVSIASRRNMDLSGSFFEKVQTALADPMVFGGVIPFIFLGIYSAAGYLGLTDTHRLDAESRTSTD